MAKDRKAQLLCDALKYELTFYFPTVFMTLSVNVLNYGSAWVIVHRQDAASIEFMIANIDYALYMFNKKVHFLFNYFYYNDMFRVYYTEKMYTVYICIHKSYNPENTILLY